MPASRASARRIPHDRPAAPVRKAFSSVRKILERPARSSRPAAHHSARCPSLSANNHMGKCTKASARHVSVFTHVLVSLPRMGQRYSQGFGCGHLPAPSTLWCASAALPLLSIQRKPIEVAKTRTYGKISGTFFYIDHTPLVIYISV